MIQKLILILSLFCVAVCLTNTHAQDAHNVLLLEFVTYQDALVLAKDHDRDIVLLFTSDNCPWCDKQKDVLTDPEVVAKLKNYVVCFVDLRKEKDIAKNYRVRSVPSYFLIDKEEKIIKKNVGYKNKSEFLNWLK